MPFKPRRAAAASSFLLVRRDSVPSVDEGWWWLELPTPRGSWALGSDIAVRYLK